jgi:hypothetical protein
MDPDSGGPKFQKPTDPTDPDPEPNTGFISNKVQSIILKIKKQTSVVSDFYYR